MNHAALLAISALLVWLAQPAWLESAEPEQTGNGPSVVLGAPLSDTAFPRPEPIVEGAEPIVRGQEMYTVRLHVDGNLVGRVRLARRKAESVPASAEISFWDEGTLIESARTDESGYFQLTSLKPVTYQATIDGRFGTFPMGVQVLPYDESAAPEQMLLDLTLARSWDGSVRVLAEPLEETSLQPICPSCGKLLPEGAVCECQKVAAACGCCKQRKHGLLGLLGLAGLAGLADGDGKKVVTPFKPDRH